MEKRKGSGAGSLSLTGRQRRQFIKRAAFTAAGSTAAASMIDSLIGPRSRAHAQAVLSWPVHSPPYISIAPGVGGYGLNTTAGSERHQSPPNPSIFFVNSLSNANSGGPAPASYGPNTYIGTLEFAIRHAASPKKLAVGIRQRPGGVHFQLPADERIRR